MTETSLSRAEASRAVTDLGWRLLLADLRTSVAVTSLQQAAEVTGAVVTACGADADAHLRVDARPDRVELSLQNRAEGTVTTRDTDLAARISSTLGKLGLRTGGATADEIPRPVQALELAIDTLDVAAIRPFWKAVLGYVDEPGDEAGADALLDPAGQLPAIWFQRMDVPRPQRNRIHFDIAVAHDEAPRRIRAALDAGGRLLTDAYAKSFWVLADAEGNEICICTWQDRDEPDDIA